ncbi:hypothetical protein [Burkholderia aenigmatica]|uniref:hypothetical protein n=1 Tax=Burkholderia aenigmatica TaxID=2015348 RepID=UPI0026520433|nr:hypothetical protein [Burkholderia aenigmatica]MDN7880511.1 hypothetical protein [Burkholderia aenigmatica]
MQFIYNKQSITTQDRITISIADLRDLVQAHGLSKNDAINEYAVILRCIAHKNHLDEQCFTVKSDQIGGECDTVGDPIF